MIDSQKFSEIRDRFGHFASWAVWAPPRQKPKDDIADLSVLDPQHNPELLETIHCKAIFLGLNISRPIRQPFGNFHDPRPMATDFKIRYALQGTTYWGAYMTDLIKDFEKKASGRVMQHLKHNKSFEWANIRLLREEIATLGCPNPKIVTFGRDATTLARRNLGKEYCIVAVPHYANFTSKEKFREQVRNRLPPLQPR